MSSKMLGRVDWYSHRIFGEACYVGKQSQHIFTSWHVVVSQETEIFTITSVIVS